MSFFFCVGVGLVCFRCFVCSPERSSDDDRMRENETNRSERESENERKRKRIIAEKMASHRKLRERFFSSLFSHTRLSLRRPRLCIVSRRVRVDVDIDLCTTALVKRDKQRVYFCIGRAFISPLSFVVDVVDVNAPWAFVFFCPLVFCPSAFSLSPSLARSRPSRCSAPKR